MGVCGIEVAREMSRRTRRGVGNGTCIPELTGKFWEALRANSAGARSRKLLLCPFKVFKKASGSVST